MRWCLALLVVGCHSSADAPKQHAVGPAWTPIMFNQLHALTPNCEMHGPVWNCTGDTTTSTVKLDDTKHLVSLEVTDLTIMSDEPARRFQIALAGVVPQPALDVAFKHLQTAWPTETEVVDGITVTVTRTQKEAGHPTLHSVTFSWQ